MIGESKQDTELRHAIITVARRIVYAELMVSIGTSLDWGDYPEIGEHDWERVVSTVEDIATSTMPGAVEYQEAYELLTARARDA